MTISTFWYANAASSATVAGPRSARTGRAPAMRRGTWIQAGLLTVIAATSLGAGSAAGADTCRLRFEPVPGRVGERATLIATGFTPNGGGILEDADQKEGPLPGHLDFDGNGGARVTFIVAPEMAGRRVFDIVDDVSDCIAGRIWLVEPAAPDTSTVAVSPEPARSVWPAELVFLLAFGVISVGLRAGSGRCRAADREHPSRR
jgi:hypothetical protein